MNVTIDHMHGYLLARVTGAIDSMTADEFFEQLQPLIEQQQSDLFLDLSETEYVNSNGIGKFIQLQKIAKQKSRRVVLISPTPIVREVLRVMKLSILMPVVDNLDAAISVIATV